MNIELLNRANEIQDFIASQKTGIASVKRALEVNQNQYSDTRIEVKDFHNVALVELTDEEAEVMLESLLKNRINALMEAEKDFKKL